MDKRLQAYLDGELERTALPDDLLIEAERWDVLRPITAEMRAEKAPAWLESKIMANLPASVAQPWWQSAAQWIMRPQAISVRPASLGLAGAAALLAVMVLNQPEPSRVLTTPVTPTLTVSNVSTPVIYVQFAFADPAARTVTVAGDFNDWDAEATELRDTDGDGVWTGLIALRPGMHKYMFVVNGEKWVTDPEAERYVDDGFGNRNAVIAITPPGRNI
ncbi:MAG TPA: isoamylase early set domain-containing protein [Longimicrobiales bacterium]